MPNHRSGWTVRRPILAVAVVAILLGLGLSWQRRQRFRALAWDYAFRADMAVQVARVFPGQPTVYHHDNAVNRSGEIRPANLAYYARMRDKYERAARYPWMTVEPDPPEPGVTRKAETTG